MSSKFVWGLVFGVVGMLVWQRYLQGMLAGVGKAE
jgi:hypothetical protein